MSRSSASNTAHDFFPRFLSQLLAVANQTPKARRTQWQNELLNLDMGAELANGQTLKNAAQAAAKTTQKIRQEMHECQAKCEAMAADRHPEVMSLMHQEDRKRELVRQRRRDVSDCSQLRDHLIRNYNHYSTWLKRAAQPVDHTRWQKFLDQATGYGRWINKWERCQDELTQSEQDLKDIQEQWNQSTQLLEQARKRWNEKNLSHVTTARTRLEKVTQQYQQAVSAQHAADHKLERWGKDTQSKIKSLLSRHGKDLAQSMRARTGSSSYASASSGASLSNDAVLWMTILGNDASSITRVAQDCGYGSYGGGHFETGGSFGGSSHSSGHSDYSDHSSSYSSSDSGSYSSDSSSSSCSCD